jgi:hypothetical protein
MKKLIIHAGAPMCAGYLVRAVLAVKEKNGDLKKLGFTFPLDMNMNLNQGNSGPLLEDFSLPNSNWDRSSNFLLEQKENIIISDDKLFRKINSNKLNKLFQAINNKFQEIVIVTAIREPSDWLLSDYAQRIKRGVSDIGFPHHVCSREANCDWLSYFAGLVKNEHHFRLVVCDYQNLSSCISELLGVEQKFLSVNTEILSFNIANYARIEAKYIYDLLAMNDNTKLEELEKVYQEYNLEKKNKALLKYIKTKNEGYVEKIKALKDVLFYGT